MICVHDDPIHKPKGRILHEDLLDNYVKNKIIYTKTHYVCRNWRILHKYLISMPKRHILHEDPLYMPNMHILHEDPLCLQRMTYFIRWPTLYAKNDVFSTKTRSVCQKWRFYTKTHLIWKHDVFYKRTHFVCKADVFHRRTYLVYRRQWCWARAPGQTSRHSASCSGTVGSQWQQSWQRLM